MDNSDETQQLTGKLFLTLNRSHLIMASSQEHKKIHVAVLLNIQVN